MPLKSIQINNRRYLGNKYRLLPFIKKIATQHCEEIKSVADIFAGTGAVASAFAMHELITNDILYSNFLCHIAWFSPTACDWQKIAATLEFYNSPAATISDGYAQQTFAGAYFSREVCAKIDFIRADIEANFTSQKINEKERAVLIASLLYACDKIAATCGHYDAYRKGATLPTTLELGLPCADFTPHPKNRCFNSDAAKIAAKIAPDLLYIDPPYNSRQYCDAYHLLENIARWECPPVFGVARKMSRDGLKSEYCGRGAEAAFAELIAAAKARYIMLSYNNMAKKGNDRSNARISDDAIMQILGKKGEVEVFATDFKPFSTGLSDIKQNQERLFLCKCK